MNFIKRSFALSGRFALFSSPVIASQNKRLCMMLGTGLLLGGMGYKHMNLHMGMFGQQFMAEC